MSNFFSEYPPKGSANVVTSLDGMTGAINLIAGANITIVDGPGTITISSAASGANKALSNLTSPTAINQNLLLDSAVSLNFTLATNDQSSIATAALNIATGHTTAAGLASGALNLKTGPGGTNANSGAMSFVTGDTDNRAGNITIQTGQGNATSSSRSGAIIVKAGDGGTAGGRPGSFVVNTGNAQAGSSQNGGPLTLNSGTGDSGTGGNIAIHAGGSSSGTGGSITLTPGLGGVNGAIVLADPSVGTAGWVWTSTDTVGSGAWAPTSATGGANQYLSNLLSPTAINQILNFDTGTTGIVQTKDDNTANTQDMEILSGASTGFNSGNIVSYTGNAESTGSNIIQTGAAASGTSGSVTLQTGSAATVSGNITLSIGNGSSSNGFIRLNPNAGGITAGAIWTATDTSGSGNWVGPGASGTFTTTDLKTVTVVNGIITSIV